MIDKIKSPYSLEIIFSYINENKKLNILMYNKKLLSKLQLNIQSYKNFNGIKIINKYRRKEYFNGQLIYDGEYKNDERNGKGKEYNKKGDICFEGKYCYGKKGKGIYYNTKFELSLYIKPLTGDRISINANYNDTIMDLKHNINEKLEIPDYYFLIFENKRLIDDKFISDYDIYNDSIIHIIKRYNTKGG